MTGGYVLLKQDGTLAQRPASLRSSGARLALSFAIVACVIALSTFFAFPRSQLPAEDAFSLHSGAGDNLKQCASNLPLPATPPAPLNLWASLTIEENVAVAKWVSAPERGFNLTQADQSQLGDNIIFLVEIFRPPKAAALAYLDSPVPENLPERYARVTIHHAAGPDPVIRDYLVGPLPVGDKSTIRQLTEIYHRDDIPFNARGFLSLTELTPLLARMMPPLAEVTKELFGAVALGLPNDTLVAAANGPMSFDGSFRRSWISWRRNVPAPWLHPLNFFQYVDISGADSDQWKVLKVVYNHQVFPSIDSFVEAFHNGTLKRLPKRPDQEDYSWSTRKPSSATGKQRDLDHLPGPRSVSFAGLRFRVDRKQQYVSWMGWGMYLGFDRDMGLSLWDLRFKNERIIYELAPQEALAHYAGNDPMQATTAWLDRFFGMGAAVRDMIPGYDCPDEAIYLPATTYTGLSILVRERAICIFEADIHRPITRHTGYHENEFGAVKGYVLTVRSIATVGNYDYRMSLPTSYETFTEPGKSDGLQWCFDYMFHLDGTIEVRLSASGYLQGGFWEPSQEGYGAAIRDTTMGSLHDHVINFKVDLDILGTHNSLLSTTTAVEQVEQPWFDDDWGSTVIQQKITRKYIENEDDALLKYPTNFQGGYSIVNKDTENRWGAPRGYAVHPGYSPVHNTVVGSKRLFNNANWARYNLAVSKRKDNELSSSSMWNMHLSGLPMVDFHKFFDGENITQTDLVAWINVGTHHLPQAEDAPNTRTNVATSSFFLTPLNYFDADVSMESMNAIVLNAPTKPGDPFTYDDFGVKPAYCVPPPVAPFEYSGVSAFGLDGKEAPYANMEEMRKAAELFHRIKVEL